MPVVWVDPDPQDRGTVHCQLAVDRRVLPRRPPHHRHLRRPALPRIFIGHSYQRYLLMMEILKI